MTLKKQGMVTTQHTGHTNLIAKWLVPNAVIWLPRGCLDPIGEASSPWEEFRELGLPNYIYMDILCHVDEARS